MPHWVNSIQLHSCAPGRFGGGAHKLVMSCMVMSGLRTVGEFDRALMLANPLLSTEWVSPHSPNSRSECIIAMSSSGELSYLVALIDFNLVEICDFDVIRTLGLIFKLGISQHKRDGEVLSRKGDNSISGRGNRRYFKIWMKRERGRRVRFTIPSIGNKVRVLSYLIARSS